MTDPAASLARRGRRVARLAAVQALYTMDVAGATAEAALCERLQTEMPGIDNGEVLPEPDGDLLSELVFGVSQRHEMLDHVIGGALTGGRDFARLEILLRCILRAGAYELANRPDIPRNVVINEYMEIAHAFFAAKEPMLVNAVLDRLADTLRASHADRPIITGDAGNG